MKTLFPLSIRIIVEMAGPAQIDFEAVDGGSCQIDSVRLWEGL